MVTVSQQLKDLNISVGLDRSSNKAAMAYFRCQVMLYHLSVCLGPTPLRGRGGLTLRAISCKSHGPLFSSPTTGEFLILLLPSKTETGNHLVTNNYILCHQIRRRMLWAGKKNKQRKLKYEFYGICNSVFEQNKSRKMNGRSIVISCSPKIGYPRGKEPRRSSCKDRRGR